MLQVWTMLIAMIAVFSILIVSSYLARKGHLAIPVHLTMVATIGSNLCFLLLYHKVDGLYLSVLMILITGIFLGSIEAFLWALAQSLIIGTIAILLPEFTLFPQCPGYFSMATTQNAYPNHCSTIIFLYFASVLLSILFQRHFNDLLNKVKSHEEEKRHLESNLLEAQKLESIGILASGIAHDFNRTLTTISCCSNLIRKKNPDDQDIQTYTSNISDMCSMINVSINGLLSFSRPFTADMKMINVHDVIKSMEWLLKLMLRKEIEVRLELHAQRPFIIGNFSKLQNIFMNLANNSRQAITGNGFFVIETKIISSSNGHTESNKNRPDQLFISVMDSGKGMDSVTLENLFKPFYTTKGTQGHGLGLVRVAELLKLHNAEKNVISSPGKGTTFELFFPLFKNDTNRSGTTQES